MFRGYRREIFVFSKGDNNLEEFLEGFPVPSNTLWILLGRLLISSDMFSQIYHWNVKYI
jgi:hypothetical protein